MLVFKIILIICALVVLVCLVGIVWQIFAEVAKPEPTKEQTERRKNLEAVAGYLETYEAWENSYKKAKTTKEKRVCEFEAMQAYEEMQKAFEALKREMVKEVEK